MSAPDALALAVEAVPLSPTTNTNTNGISALNAVADIDNGGLSSGPDSPAIPSPPNNAASPPVKIDLDYTQRESDARHEPISLSLKKQDDVSASPQLSSPVDPGPSPSPFFSRSPSDAPSLSPASIPIAPQNGTPPPPPGQLLDDVQMAETETTETSVTVDASPMPASEVVNGVGETNGVNGVNGTTGTEPVANGLAYSESIDNMNVDTPVASTSRLSVTQDVAVQDDGQPPPAKRARKFSDAEQASFSYSPVPQPPPSTATTSNGRSPTPSPPKERKATLSQQQFRFCISTVRQLRKLKDAGPFLAPVDAVALNIPHYHSIIKHPMDFSTIDRKLASSNPTKPDSNPSNPRYLNADEFISDVRQIFVNATTFNGAEHPVTSMGKRVEAVFDKQIKQLPPPAEEVTQAACVEEIVDTSTGAGAPIPALSKKTASARRPSTSIPTIRRSEVTETARPKREIHPPPPKDLPYAEPSKKSRSMRKSKASDGTEEQLKFCAKLLADLHKKSHAAIASPFYEPVDPIKLGIPNYPKVVKKPMDISTMKKKLDNREYANADKFYDDFALMIKNCMAFNPVGTPVHLAGVELQRVFEEKFVGLPPLKAVLSEEEDEDDEDSEEDHTRTIAIMEDEIEAMRGKLAALRNQSKKHKKEKKEKKRDKRVSPPIASSSKANGKPTKAMPKKKSSKKEKIPDDDVLSFDQKKDLSETITTLDGEKLEKVISIIHEGVPEIRDSTEEIELDIDALPAHVLMKLYNFVLRPMRSAPTKRSRTGTGTGTGGLKRKSMDEDVEAERIRQLEERIKMFDNKPSARTGVGKRNNDDSEHSSSDSSSDSSGSDSE